MQDFSITLDGKEYKCSSIQSNKDSQDWHITVSHGKVKTTISIPIEEKITRVKVILFIEAFHVAMHQAFDAQKLDQNYIWNQKTTIN